MSKLYGTVVSGIKFQSAGHVRNVSVFNFTIDLNIAGDGFYIDRTPAYVQRRDAFHVFSAQVAAISAQIYVAFTLRYAQVTAPGGHGESKLRGQLQVEIKTRFFKITAGQVQQPEVPLLDKLG